MSHISTVSGGRNASILNFLLTIVLTVLVFIYVSLAAYTKDALWFYPAFDAQPVLGVIRCYGEEIALQNDSVHLFAVASLVNEQISGNKRWDELNLTDQTYLEYKTGKNVVILELFYDEPQRIHSQSPFFSGFDTLLIPLDGRHASTNILFNLVRGKPSGGSFHVETYAPLLFYLEENGLCTLQ